MHDSVLNREHFLSVSPLTTRSGEITVVAGGGKRCKSFESMTCDLVDAGSNITNDVSCVLQSHHKVQCVHSKSRIL